jgi:hypothetical protein
MQDVGKKPDRHVLPSNRKRLSGTFFSRRPIERQNNRRLIGRAAWGPFFVNQFERRRCVRGDQLIAGRLEVWALRTARALALFVGLLALSACGGKHEGERSSPTPVEECRQYEDAVRRCFHRDVSIATQPSLLAVTKADRERIGASCSENLKRIQQACR